MIENGPKRGGKDAAESHRSRIPSQGAKRMGSWLTAGREGFKRRAGLAVAILAAAVAAPARAYQPPSQGVPSDNLSLLNDGGLYGQQPGSIATTFEGYQLQLAPPANPVDTATATPVPEPAGSTLLLIGCASYLMRRRPRAHAARRAYAA